MARRISFTRIMFAALALASVIKPFIGSERSHRHTQLLACKYTMLVAVDLQNGVEKCANEGIFWRKISHCYSYTSYGMQRHYRLSANDMIDAAHSVPGPSISSHLCRWTRTCGLRYTGWGCGASPSTRVLRLIVC